jgi:hypothetical protein
MLIEAVRLQGGGMVAGLAERITDVRAAGVG